MSASQLPPMPRGMLPMFDVVCSRKASGPWELPGIVGTPAGAGGIGWEGPGCGIPIATGGIAGGLETAAAGGPVGEPPIAGADGLRFSIACQCCSRSLCFCIRAFFRSSSALSSVRS